MVFQRSLWDYTLSGAMSYDNTNIDMKCYLNFGNYNSSQLFLCLCERAIEIGHVYIEAYINLTDKRYIISLYSLQTKLCVMLSLILICFISTNKKGVKRTIFCFCLLLSVVKLIDLPPRKCYLVGIIISKI